MHGGRRTEVREDVGRSKGKGDSGRTKSLIFREETEQKMQGGRRVGD